MLFTILCTGTLTLNKNNMDTLTLKKSIGALTDQLLYSSESDYPFEFRDLNKKSLGELQQAIEALYPADAPSSSMSGTDFFNRYIRKLEISGDDVMIAIAERYKKLQSFLATNTSDVLVWRFGKIEVGVYIVIQTKNAELLVLKTTAIET
jgi:hypothetical protein